MPPVIKECPNKEDAGLIQKSSRSRASRISNKSKESAEMEFEKQIEPMILAVPKS